MTDYGLGALQSPPDERDYPIEQLFATSGIAAATPPATFDVTLLPPVYNQGNTPMCVAFSSSTLKGAEDLIDQKHNYLWDRPTFFRRIGGGPNGAVTRNALDRMLKVGYPLLPPGSNNSQAAHRIAAYYSIPKTRLAICQTIWHFGAILLSTPWFNSWFDPHTDGRLPVPDYQVGGHAIAAIGWDSIGLHLRNSWGTAWGVKGNCTMPWPYVLAAVWEAWKAVDVIERP